MSDSDSDNELSVSQQQADEDWEDWDGDEEEDDATKSLFSDAVLPSPEAACEHDGTNHGFDIRQYKIERQLGDYDVIKVINFIRSEVAAGRDPLPALVSAGEADSSTPWSADDYLRPVLADDPLLTYDYEELPSSRPVGTGAGSSSSAAAAAATGGSAAAAEQMAAQLQALSAENQELKLRVAALMDAALPRDVREELRAAAAEDGSSSSATTAATAGGSSSSVGASSSSAAASTAVSAVIAGGGAALAAAAVDAQYFDSYSSFDIHHEMLSDQPRTSAYQAALTQNPSLLCGAAVLDVGCGTSILSLFSAKGGAATVVGLDGSERIAGFARQIVAANKLDAATGGPISIIAGKVEAIESIGVAKVDVIVSEWMGYALLFESMLDSVLAARDKWLAPGGAVLPDIATIHVAGASRQCLGTQFWEDVYGFKMQPIADELTAAAAREAQVLVRPVPTSSLTTPSLQVHVMDLATMTAAQQDFTAHFELSATTARSTEGPPPPAAAAAGEDSSVSSSSTEVAALVLWFDTEFSVRFCKDHPVTLSTSPHQPVTHWAQAVLPLASPVLLQPGDGPGSTLSCRLSMARSRAKHRSLDISLEYSCGSVKATRIYSMEVSSSSSSSK